MFSSFLSGACVGALTCCSKILFQTLNKYEGDYMYIDKVTYILIAVMVIIFTINIINLNLNTRLFSQLYVLPLYESFSICFNLVSGGLIIGEFQAYENK